MAQKQRDQNKQRLQIVHSFYAALSILDRLVHTPGSMTPEALAQALSEDETGIVPRVARSIRRYLKRFEELGFCFEKGTGVHGIHVPQAFRQKLHVLNFTEGELIALYFHLGLLGDMVQGSDLAGPSCHRLPEDWPWCGRVIQPRRLATCLSAVSQVVQEV